MVLSQSQTFKAKCWECESVWSYEPLIAYSVKGALPDFNGVFNLGSCPTCDPSAWKSFAKVYYLPFPTILAKPSGLWKVKCQCNRCKLYGSS